MLSTLAIIVVVICNLYLLPNEMSVSWFYRALTHIALIALCLQVITYLVHTATKMDIILWAQNPFSYVGGVTALGSYNRDGTFKNLFLAFIFGTAILINQYRAGFIALFVSVLFYLVYKKLGSKALRVTAWSLVVCTPVLLLIIAVFGNMLPVHFSGRSEIWAASLWIIGEQPLFGYGFGNMRALIVNEIHQLGGPALQGPHNAILAWALQIGVVGAVLYYITVSCIFLRPTYRNNLQIGLFSLFAGFFIIWSFSSSSLFGIKFLSIIQALTAGLLLRYSRADPNSVAVKQPVSPGRAKNKRNTRIR
jgi:O-antigen ligase